MKRRFAIPMSLLALMLFSTEGLGLPACLGAYSEISWDKCLGTRLYDDGNKYVGDWKSGNLHGRGTLMWRNGEKYEGMFVNNKLHGQGTLTYANGDKYIGSWNSLDNYPNGFDIKRFVKNVTEQGINGRKQKNIDK